MELRSRFDENSMSVIDGFYCIPAVMARNDDWKLRLKSFMLKYKKDMPIDTSFDAEIDLWENLWLTGSKEHKYLPQIVPETLNSMLNKIYPNIYAVLRILAVLPVTTCSCERSISTLRRVKTYLRNSMTQVCDK